MPIVAADWTITRSTKVIDYIGDDHLRFGGITPSYATVIEFHRWVQGLADDAEYTGDDEMDIININPSARSTDNIITLVGGYTVTAAAAEHLYDGTIIQGSAGVDQKIWDGIVNFGNSSVIIQLIQNGGVTTDDWWNLTGGGGLNADSANGISHRFMVLVHDFVGSGGDIDGRRLLGTSRTYGNTYGEFKINGTSRGNNVLALSDASDLNNTTAQATVDAYADVFIDRTITTATVSGVNSTGQAVLNVTDGTQFTDGDFIMTAVDNQEYKILSIATNALTLNRNLVTATTGGEATYILNIGFAQIDVDNNTINEDYYSQWDLGAQSINGFYEYTKNLSRDGTDHYIYGISGELFRGITDEITVDTPTGTFDAVESVSWTGGTGQMLAINSPTAATKMWIQLLTGTSPGDNVVITGGNSTATATVNVTVTDRSSLIKTPFVGASTGSAIIGSYGLTLQTTDLSASDKVFDLTNTQVVPPNNVTFTLSGLVVGEDRVLIAPWDGATTDADGNPEVDYNQNTLNGTLSGAAVTAVVVTTAIASDTPSTGVIRVQRDSGLYSRIAYTSWTGSTYTIGSTDFSGDIATTGNNVFLGYIDKLAAATSETFTGVYLADRSLVIKVRDGAASPIKEFISSGTLGSNGGSSTTIRTVDS
jgi:hypothetical protein